MKNFHENRCCADAERRAGVFMSAKKFSRARDIEVVASESDAERVRSDNGWKSSIREMIWTVWCRRKKWNKTKMQWRARNWSEMCWKLQFTGKHIKSCRKMFHRKSLLLIVVISTVQVAKCLHVEISKAENLELRQQKVKQCRPGLWSRVPPIEVLKFSAAF